VDWRGGGRVNDRKKRTGNWTEMLKKKGIALDKGKGGSRKEGDRLR